jgi:PAS domain S-box-containing protein
VFASEPVLKNRSLAPFIPYGVTVLIVGSAAALRWALGQGFGPFPLYITFYPAMMLSALLGGVGPGLLATGLAGFLADWMFLPPISSLGVDLLSDAVGLVLFCGIGIFISLIAGRLRAARTETEIIRQSEERFRALADNIAQLAWIADGQGSAIWYNRRWYDYTGATLEEMEGSGWQNLHHPEHLQRVVEKMNYSFGTGQVWEDTFPLRGKDGKYRWFFSTAIPLLDKDGKVWRWFGTHTDVTAQREAEQALRRFELLAGQSRDIILFVRHGDGRILEANDAAVNAYGYTRGELLALSIYDLRVADTQGLIASQMAAADAQGILFEAIHRRKDGSTFPVEVSSRGATIEGARTLISVIRDITGRKRAEEALRRANERFARVLGGITDLYVSYDREWRFTELNPQAEYVLRKKREEVLGQVLWQVFPESKKGEIYRRYQGAMASQIPVHFEIFLEVAGRWFEVHAYPSEEGLSTYWRDVTERKETEKALSDRTVQLERLNRELVALNTELDDFTRMASHDLQEPLRTLTAFNELLPKDLGRSLPERAARDLGFITDAAKRMQTLIEDLLALSRAGRVAKKREKVSLAECADRALEALALRVKETGAQIARGHLPEVWGDPTLLTQIYQNLIGNALKFSGDQPPVIQLTFEEREKDQVFGVRDNGIGIEPKYAQRIFEPFMRLHSRAEYEGSGIGLAICRKIVERHGGKIWVESEPGKGAHFRFTILRRMRERSEP